MEITDCRLARVVRQCQELPGQELFQYVDESGCPRSIESGDVNEYLREISGGDFTAKDFRTWEGSVLAARYLREGGPVASERESRQQIVEAVKRVAERLANTPAVCRRCYVHPAVMEVYAGGLLPEMAGGSAEGLCEEESLRSLSEDERLLVSLLRKHAANSTDSLPPRRQLESRP